MDDDVILSSSSTTSHFCPYDKFFFDRKESNNRRESSRLFRLLRRGWTDTKREDRHRFQTSRERERERCGWQTLEILFIHAKFDIEAACFLRFSYSTIEFHPREDSWNLAYERNNFPSWSSILTKDPRSNLQRGYYLTKIRSVYIYIWTHVRFDRYGTTS